jgi:hypothetical protein
MRCFKQWGGFESRWLRAIAQGSTLLGLFMIALIWAGLRFHQEVGRSSAEREAVQNADNLARAFEEHLSRSLKDIDRSLKIARSRYQQHPDDLDFRGWLRDSQLFDDQTVQVGIIGPDGRLRLSSMDTPSSPKNEPQRPRALSGSPRCQERRPVHQQAGRRPNVREVVGSAQSPH